MEEHKMSEGLLRGMTNGGMTDRPTDLGKWVSRTLDELNEGLYERRDAVALSLLAVLSGQSVFLYGPPGTAKSLIARRLSGIFSDSKYFEYLMQRFSTPEEVFGPVSISELKNDNYVRMTEHYLPSADIAFLDEIWKSSPAILNTLLTIINERRFRNGTEITTVPLKAIISASNEFPAASSGLDALYDRFIMRLPVNPLEERGSFEALLSSGSAKADCVITETISEKVWSDIITMSDVVTVSPEAMEMIHAIREAISEESSGDGRVRLYVSDRRWLNSVRILKTAAHLCGRQAVDPVDIPILKYCLWSSDENRPVVSRIIDRVLVEHISEVADRIGSWQENLVRLSKEVRDLFENAPKAPREPTIINGLGCYATTAGIGPSWSPREVFVPYGPKRIGGIYQAWDSDRLPVQFQVQEVADNTATIRFTQSGAVAKVPVMLGDLEAIPRSTIDTYRRSLANAREDLMSLRKVAEDERSGADRELIFTPMSDWKVVLDHLDAQVRALSGQETRIDELVRLIDDYEN
ncbi:MAG: AAA family ATPase [archaeon]|nr:AAA family ATPase [archaeon]